MYALKYIKCPFNNLSGIRNTEKKLLNILTFYKKTLLFISVLNSIIYQNKRFFLNTNILFFIA